MNQPKSLVMCLLTLSIAHSEGLHFHAPNVIKKLISKLSSKNTSSLNNHLDKKANIARWVKPPGYNVIPSGAFEAGRTPGRVIYVARGFYRIGSMNVILPGRAEKDLLCAQVTWSGFGHCLGNYEFLIGSKYTWIPAFRTDWVSNPKLVLAGTDLSGANIYVCRYIIRTDDVAQETDIVIGKAKLNGDCDAGYFGKQLTFYNMYEVLVHNY